MALLRGGLWRAALRTPVHGSSFYLIATEAVSATLGLGFWALVARLYADREVGTGSVLITSGTLLATAATVGLNVGLIRFLPENRANAGAMINSATTVTAAIAGVLAAAFAVTTPLVLPTIGFLARDPRSFLIFVGFVGVWGAYLVSDAAFIGLGVPRYVLARAVTYGGLKLALPLALIPSLPVPVGLFSAWGLGLLAANVLAFVVWYRRTIPEYVPRLQVRPATIAPMMRYAMTSHVATLLGALPGLAFPAVIARALLPENAAYFYVAWAIASILHLVPGSIFLSVFAEGSRSPSDLRQRTREGLFLAFALLVPAVVGVLLLSEPLLTTVFRPSYAAAASTLGLLALSSFFLAINLAYAAALRVHKRLAPLLVLYATTSLGVLGLGYLLMGTMGLIGVGVAFALVQGAAAAFTAPGIARGTAFEARRG